MVTLAIFGWSDGAWVAIGTLALAAVTAVVASKTSKLARETHDLATETRMLASETRDDVQGQFRPVIVPACITIDPDNPARTDAPGLGRAVRSSAADTSSASRTRAGASP